MAVKELFVPTIEVVPIAKVASATAKSTGMYDALSHFVLAFTDTQMHNAGSIKCPYIFPFAVIIKDYSTAKITYSCKLIFHFKKLSLAIAE